MAISCGHVYHLDLAIAGKPKLVVPAYVQPPGRVRFFVINTNRTQFQTDSQEITNEIVPLLLAEYPKFLTHNSWLTCHEVVGGWMEDEMEKVKGCYRAPLSAKTLATVRTLVLESRFYSEMQKKLFSAQWPQ